MDIPNLINRMRSGDTLAARGLIEAQRHGRALRLYPDGRNGPNDEGVAPILLEQTENLLVHLRLGRPCIVVLRRDQLGPVLMFLFRCSARMMANLDRYDESSITPGIGYQTGCTNDPWKIVISFSPHGRIDYDLGIEDCISIITSWLTFIDQHEWEIDDCSLTDEEYMALSHIANHV